MHGRADPRVPAPARSAPTRVGPAVEVAVAEPALHAFERLAVHSGRQVERVQQGDPDARVLGGRAISGVAHGVRVGVGRAVRAVVQVVELADAGDAGQRHLAVDGPGQREVAVRVEAAGDRVHQLAPGPEAAAARRGCGRAAPGGRRASARWPDRAGPARAAACRPAAAPGVTAVNRPSVTSISTSALDPARRSRRKLARSTSCRASSSTVASASTPAAQSSSVGVLGGGVRDPGRVADEQHRGRHVRGQHPGVVPGPGRQDRRAAEQRRRAARPARCRRRPRRTTDSGGRPSTSVPSRPARSAARLTTASTSRSSVAVSAARASSQPRTSDGIALVAFGSHRDPGHGGVRAGQPGLLVGGQHRVREGQHRVVPVGHPGGAGVVARRR